MALAARAMPDAAFRLTLAADPLAVRQALARIMASCLVAALTDDHRASVEIVLAEVLNNIAEHAYAAGKGDISVSLQAIPAGLDCRISDQGQPMPDGAIPSGTLPVEAYPEGGFGWFLIRSLTTGLDYRRVDGTNQLHFVIPA